MILDTYAIQIVLDDESQPVPLLDLRGPLAECEENLTDLMPPGYRARITHWAEADHE